MRAHFVVRGLRHHRDRFERWLPKFLQACSDADRYGQDVPVVLPWGLLVVTVSPADSGERRFVTGPYSLTVADSAWTQHLDDALRAVRRVLG